MQSIFRNGVMAAALMLASAPGIAGVVVIVSAKSPVTSLSKDQVASLYLGKTTALPGGGGATLYDLPEANPSRQPFYEAATGKSVSQVKSVWSRLVFSGRVLPPHEAASDSAMVHAVAADPTAVGYVDSAALDGTVKAVLKL